LIKPKTMTPLELQEEIIDAYQSFYSNKKMFNHLKKMEFFYGAEIFYVKFLFKRIIRQNQEYLEYLEKFSN